MPEGPFSEASPPPLGFQRWSRMSAALTGATTEEQMDALMDEDVDPALWDAVNAYWATEIGRRLAAGDPSLADQHSATCAEVLKPRSKEGGVPALTASTRPSPVAGIASTAFLSVSDVEEAGELPAMPFAGQALPPPRMEEAPHPAMGATGVVDPAAVAGMVTTPFNLPAAVDAAPDAAEIDKYAMYVAYVEKGVPEETRRLFEQLGLDDDGTAVLALDQRMGRVLRRDPAAKARFERECERWRVWLTTRGARR